MFVIVVQFVIVIWECRRNATKASKFYSGNFEMAVTVCLESKEKP